MQWSVVSRFGGDANGDGALDQTTRISPETPAELDVFPVVIEAPAAACSSGSSALWLVDRRERPATVTAPEGPCRVMHHVRGEGRHPIELRVGGDRYIARVEVDDRLVVALGDSVASGEGNPVGPRRWLDAPCHRSTAAGFEQAARLLAEGLKKRSITFVSLACSGAEVREGLLEEYRGVAPAKEGGAYKPQVERLETIAGQRGRRAPAVDAVLLSVGANDVRFSGVVKQCGAPGDCQSRLDRTVFADIQALSDRYNELAPRLEDAAPKSPVLISEYFDPTRDETGRAFCRSSVAFTTSSEARFAYESLLMPLNEEVSTAARRHGWLYVGGIAADFAPHGYCADPAERWVRRLERSLFSQRDLSGTLHPNEKGHIAIADRVAPRLSSVLGLPAKKREAKEEGDDRSLLELGAQLAGGVLFLAAVIWLVLLVPRLVRLATRPVLPDPCTDTAGSPELREVSRARDILIPALVGVALLGLALLLVGAVGGALVWVRFWAARLPADQAVDAVAPSELGTTGAQALALFAVLGLVAVVVVWLFDGKGQWVRATRRGLGLLIVAELLVAVVLEDFRSRHALQLILGFVIGAILLHYLVDRALAVLPALRRERLARWVIRTGRAAFKGMKDFFPPVPGGPHSAPVRVARGALGLAPVGFAVYWVLARDTDPWYPVVIPLVLAAILLAVPRRWILTGLLWGWRALPLILIVYAMYRAVSSDGPNRLVLVGLPLLLAAMLLVSPGGVAHDATAAKPEARLALEPPRLALAVGMLFCLLVLLTRDEAWLAGTAVVAALLAAACLAIAGASKQQFAPYGLAVLISVPLFGAALDMLRTVNSPKVQPVAVLLRDGTPLCGAYVGESDGRLWIARVELAELGHVRRPPPRRGRIFPVSSADVAEWELGPLQPVARAQDQALALRNELLHSRGKPTTGLPQTCAASEPEEQVEPSWQRELAQRFQPELVLHRSDGFWPVPVRTLFALEDRRAHACRWVGGGARDSCVRLTTPGAFPWSGGEGEAIEYPAAENRRDDQHFLMTNALGSVDPARTAREYFLVNGEKGARRPVTLQYWFFYTFNYQPLDAALTELKAGYHEGDFESVGVLLSAETRRPRYVWMARHNEEGRVFTWDDDAIHKAGDHPTVFVARGSHASYEGCQRQRRYEAPGGLIDDRPACEGQDQLHLAPESTRLTDLSRTSWACWEGLFGHRRGGGYERIPYLVNDAPRSPLWQQDFDDVVSQPCQGVEDPGGRDGTGEEVLDEAGGVPATLRNRAGRLEPLVDECADWEKAPADGPYMVACNQNALSRYVASGFENPGLAGVRIDSANVERPELGSVTQPAVRQAAGRVYLSDWRIAAARPTRVAVFASCRQQNRIVAARFPKVPVRPGWPLRLSDRDPGGWRLRREDGKVVAVAKPSHVRGEKTKRPPRCSG